MRRRTFHFLSVLSCSLLWGCSDVGVSSLVGDAPDTTQKTRTAGMGPWHDFTVVGINYLERGVLPAEGVPTTETFKVPCQVADNPSDATRDLIGRGYEVTSVTVARNDWCFAEGVDSGHVAGSAFP